LKLEWVLTIANATGTNGLTGHPKHGVRIIGKVPNYTNLLFIMLYLYHNNHVFVSANNLRYVDFQIPVLSLCFYALKLLIKKHLRVQEVVDAPRTVRRRAIDAVITIAQTFPAAAFAVRIGLYPQRRAIFEFVRKRIIQL
jgi:hypothetical protein